MGGARAGEALVRSRAVVAEWFATFSAAGLLALLLALNATHAPDPAISDVAQAREVELPFKLVDAGAAVPADMREAIGLGKDASQDVQAALKALERAIEDDPAIASLLLIAAAVAVSQEADELALVALDRIAEDEAGLEAWRVGVDNLHDLARGLPARQLPPTLSELKNAGASQWLLERVQGRDARNAGRPAESVEAVAQATARASRFASAAVTSLVIVGTLFVLGCLLLLLWPLVSRALTAHGHVGLGQLPSPFITAATRRVAVLWFLSFLGVGMGLELLLSPANAGPIALALNVVVQTVVAGGVGLWLIQNLARRPEDPTPLWVPLRLGALRPAGGLLGVALWTAAGLGIAVAVVSAASIVQAGLSGAPEQAQPILRLFAEDEDPRVRAAIAVSAVVMAPFFEEIFFRGFVFRNLRDLLGPPLAMGLSALLFGLVHLQAPQIVPLTALGIVLAFLYERSGSLLVPIGVHALWNLGQLVITQQMVTG
jgi:membrane protease YdiL (CAAX protease family)